MSTSSEQMQNAARLWHEHRYAPFPAGLRRAKGGGTDVWLLDLYTAGCVVAWLNNGGTLDPENSRILQSCIEDLDQFVPEINDPAGTQYYQRLHQLALLVSRDLTGTT
ncbi:hypothetical protein ACGFYQ_35130 [Streptomyces sp. NPDC048258]|uniref:hypothetical protein n=1 Tax=Streptomyces sp. NPDC048258 TaxID=3365527 RepID=UPI0037246B28